MWVSFVDWTAEAGTNPAYVNVWGSWRSADRLPPFPPACRDRLEQLERQRERERKLREQQQKEQREQREQKERERRAEERRKEREARREGEGGGLV